MFRNPVNSNLYYLIFFIKPLHLHATTKSIKQVPCLCKNTQLATIDTQHDCHSENIITASSQIKRFNTH